MEEFKFEPQTMTVEQLTIHILRIFLQKKIWVYPLEFTCKAS